VLITEELLCLFGRSVRNIDKFEAVALR